MFKEIKNFKGYLITDQGEVLGSRFKKPLKQFADKDGYPRVGLSRAGKVSSVRVHRLVAEAFIKNPHNKNQVHHRDNNRANAKVENLEWVNQKENIHRILWKFIDCPKCNYHFSPAGIKTEDN